MTGFSFLINALRPPRAAFFKPTAGQVIARRSASLRSATEFTTLSVCERSYITMLNFWRF